MTGTVRVVYLVSKDRRHQPTYSTAIWQAVKNVQGWYRRQLDGKTFILGSGVEVVNSDKNASWFAKNKVGSDPDSYHFRNALLEVARLKSAKPHDPKNCWVIYSDAPGNKGRGGGGVCMLPEDDLLGLTGKHKETNKNRWIGGLAHELGHAMGLPHPSDTKRHHNALMHLGYASYPSTYLTPSGKTKLKNGPYIEGGAATWTWSELAWGIWQSIRTLPVFP